MNACANFVLNLKYENGKLFNPAVLMYTNAKIGRQIKQWRTSLDYHRNGTVAFIAQELFSSYCNIFIVARIE